VSQPPHERDRPRSEVIEVPTPVPVVAGELVDDDEHVGSPPARADGTAAAVVEAVTVTGIALIALLNRLSDPDGEE